MEQEKKGILTRYLVSFGVASLITLIVCWIRGFFTDSIAVNIQVLSDGFFVSGAVLTLFVGMLYISDEGALIGIGFVLRNVALAFIPMGRKRHEVYAQYRERKMAKKKRTGKQCILVAGLTFLLIGAVLAVIWYVKFYQPPV